MRKIYFVIPVYMVEKYLRRCIDSVLCQSYENTEIVVVDDGSPDRCPEICDSYGAEYSRITVIHKKNGGLSDARNAGLMYVAQKADDDDYISFVDSDDFVYKSYAERLIELMEQNGCDIIQCGYIKGSGDRFDSEPKKGSVFCADPGDALLGYDLKSQMFGKIFRFGLFRRLRFPVGMLNEDEFVTYKAVWAAHRIAFTDEKLFYYFQRPDSIMSDVAKKMKNNPHRYDYLKAYREREKFFGDLGRYEQVQRTHEKICSDIILRYCEQMYLEKSRRDEDCMNGEYMRLYRESYKKMIGRRNMPQKRRLMYMAFNICPMSAVLAGKVFTLRK